MARHFPFLTIGFLFLVVGCQSNSMVQNLPAPNFNGPVVNQQPPVAIAPRMPVASAQRPVRPGNGLAGDRAWIPNAPARPWKWIVIHHSATPSGSAAVFDKMHRAKGWDELGYHFVIGNGTNSGDGQVEVGSRWPKQKWGAHAKTPDNQFNDYGIGICLVGNFDIERPTPKQMQSLTRLVAYLMETYHIPASRVLGHRDTKSTDCPGKNLSVAQVRQMATHMLAEAGEAVEPDARTAGSAELFQDLTVMPANSHP